MTKFVVWLSRVLAVLFVLFVSIFAFDVFEEYTGWDLFVAFLAHLLPSIILLVGIILAWRYEPAGAIIFFAFAFWYVVTIGTEGSFLLYAILAGPAILVGILYLISGFLRSRRQKAEENIKIGTE